MSKAIGNGNFYGLGKGLERKIFDPEGANFKLTETNVALTKINKRLMDECAIKSSELHSLNGSLIWMQQEVDECKEALTCKGQEIGAMTTELANLVHNEGNVRHSVKEKMTKEFCE